MDKDKVTVKVGIKLVWSMPVCADKIFISISFKRCL
jgi:hypothetical protein